MAVGQKNPHLILLNEDFYHEQMKPILCQWLGLWLTGEHVGRVFEVGYSLDDLQRLGSSLPRARGA